MSGKLFLVATPIGNLQDVTQRALDTLKSCAAIACEDTRVTSKLLAAYGISKPLIIFHEHTQPASVDKLIGRIEAGEDIVYVSDAGTPNMNDPGGKLAQAAYEAGLTLVPIPGASVLTTAISVCGFDMQDFHYLGFIPHKKGRQTLFKQIAENPTPSVFLESTHRIDKTLASLHETLESRRLVFVGRELTKLHETLYRGTCDEVIRRLAATSTKGEFIVIVGPKPKG
ncbi:MAG: 16S rRNA (cytidine(1402)-2'-O)-methyltransferase [Patescibacteria group bacterium]|nr:16S rRNA (cytidine(1402)-2'-O)-methyltransferase [Patescibacteria group bacterium]